MIALSRAEYNSHFWQEIIKMLKEPPKRSTLLFRDVFPEKEETSSRVMIPCLNEKLTQGQVNFVNAEMQFFLDNLK